jgi:hypothetical protein
MTPEEIYKTIKELSRPCRRALDKICSNDSQVPPYSAGILIRKGLAKRIEVDFNGITGAYHRYSYSIKVHAVWCQICEEESKNE